MDHVIVKRGRVKLPIEHRRTALLSANDSCDVCDTILRDTRGTGTCLSERRHQPPVRRPVVIVRFYSKGNPLQVCFRSCLGAKAPIQKPA